VNCRFYFDEDSADKALVEALRRRGVDVSVPSEVGLMEADDAEQLQWCIRNQRVLITSNVDDFYHLHTQLLGQGGSHPGMVAIQQQSLGIGERMRRLLKLWSSLSTQEMVNRIEFLSHWGTR
jgi:predicted nuclease of predicted toxin-antitoxin system